MSKRLLYLCLIIALALNLSSCAFHDDPRVDAALNPTDMDNAFGYQPSSIKPYKKCEETCEVALINVENREVKYVFWDPASTASYTPQKFTGTIINYMEEEFARRGVKINSECPKKIMVSLGEAKIEPQVFSVYGFFELKVAIPDLNYQRTYKGEDASMDLFLALAYTVHHSVMEFMKDPVVVKYIESKP